MKASGFGPNYSQIILASFRASHSWLMLDYVRVINFFFFLLLL